MYSLSVVCGSPLLLQRYYRAKKVNLVLKHSGCPPRCKCAIIVPHGTGLRLLLLCRCSRLNNPPHFISYPLRNCILFISNGEHDNYPAAA